MASYSRGGGAVGVGGGGGEVKTSRFVASRLVGQNDRSSITPRNRSGICEC